MRWRHCSYINDMMTFNDGENATATIIVAGERLQRQLRPCDGGSVVTNRDLLPSTKAHRRRVSITPFQYDMSVARGQDPWLFACQLVIVLQCFIFIVLRTADL